MLHSTQERMPEASRAKFKRCEYMITGVGAAVRERQASAQKTLQRREEAEQRQLRLQ